MKKNLFAAIIALLCPFALWAQLTLQGKITDAENQNPLIGATISLDNSSSTQSDGNGSFNFKNLKKEIIPLR